MRYKTKDRIEFAIFCLWFFTVGWAYYFLTMTWHSMTEKQQLKVVVLLGISLTPFFFVALSIVTACPSAAAGVC